MRLVSVLTLMVMATFCLRAQVAPIVPPAEELDRPFGENDKAAFKAPGKVYYPETWFHFIGGNVTKAGITKDLEAIAHAGIEGIQLFHGQFGGPWPGVDTQIACLSPLWEDAIQHTAQECRRLGLRFTMQNCPGWAMAGGPWITPANAMRNLAWSRTDIQGGHAIQTELDQPQPSSEPWRDYKDIAVLAFPTPLDDSPEPVTPLSVTGSGDIAWSTCFLGQDGKPVQLAPAPSPDSYWAEVSFANAVTIRTIQFPSVNSMGHAWNYEPGVSVRAQAILANGEAREILNTRVPAANFQDNQRLSFACTEVKDIKKIRIFIENKHKMALGVIQFYTAARKNNWESEAAWTLRNIDRSGVRFHQSPQANVDPAKIIDISKMMDAKGNLSWNAPAGKWTILRIGHVNTGKKNGPAPPEGTGWECNKLSETGADAHFAGYIGALSGSRGVLGNGLLNGMLMDSWECERQTWTENMETEFARVEAYPLRKWIPALFGFVLKDQETTFKFLRDWRATINDLYTHKFYARMATLARQNNLAVSYETAAGDVFPADIMEYYKFADVPMCEFWQPFTEGYVGSLNFKPIKPAASAARLYGKRRLGAEAFTSFNLTYDEHWQDLKEVANVNIVEGVTHLIFHTYTHNPPRADSLKPGTSFGAHIGTPFLRQQTWWKDMPQLTTYFARCSYMLEKGKPVSDVLWYLGDEIDHKPDQEAAFPKELKYDYCNPDVLLHRLSVEDGMLVTPEGIRYSVLWMPSTTHMLPETLEKLESLIRAGATVMGERPQMVATLSGGDDAAVRFDKAVQNIWGDPEKPRFGRLGKGQLMSHLSPSEALALELLTPDVKGGDVLWSHRRGEGADWYFVTAPKGGSFKGTLDFRNTGSVEIWDPVTGKVAAAAGVGKNGRTSVALDLPVAGSCFVVFNHGIKAEVKGEIVVKPAVSKEIGPWTLSFPAGWGAPASIQVSELKPWKDLDMSPEAKAFSGTALYAATFDVDRVGARFSLDLGKVDMIAKVRINGKDLGTLWCEPYRLDITDAVVAGKNALQIEVTGTWFNRLAYDAGLPEDQRKTWTISGPDKGSPLRNSGLLGPVTISVR